MAVIRATLERNTEEGAVAETTMVLVEDHVTLDEAGVAPVEAIAVDEADGRIEEEEAAAIGEEEVDIAVDVVATRVPRILHCF